MKMLPTLYSLANTSGKTGVLMQPMAYADLTDPQTYDIWDQFLIGDTILVAPVFFQKQINAESIYQRANGPEMDNPKASYTGGQWIEIEAPLDTLPRFVKNNRLYLTGNIYQGSDRNWKEDEPQLTVHVFSRPEGLFIQFSPTSIR